jgi:hypothetical protein
MYEKETKFLIDLFLSKMSNPMIYGNEGKVKTSIEGISKMRPRQNNIPKDDETSNK